MRQIDGGTSGGCPGARANALWGKGRKRYPLLLAISVIAISGLAATTSASAADISNLTRVLPEAPPPAPKPSKKPFVPNELEDAALDAKGDPDTTFSVIIQADDPGKLSALNTAVSKAQTKHPGKGTGVEQEFSSLGAVAAEVTGDQLQDLAAVDALAAITEDGDVHPTGYDNPQTWVETVEPEWGAPPKHTDFPTIAIVDSGIQGRGDFLGNKILKQVDFTSEGGKYRGDDGFGHGTMVAGLAAGERDGFTGVEPRAKLVSLDVLDNSGNGTVSDVLAACDWILKNKNKYGIDIANFSINAGSGAGIGHDPLNKAVETLWLNGVVVIAAAGNYARDGAESGVGFAPANDPFVITVGASDTNDTPTPSDDFAAPWSAWGYTQDGFRKPELAAPGRQLIAPVQKDSFLWNLFPSREVADGYMWMSGTSFAAPLVAGAAATLLSRHPEWTPDQVKGALMTGASVPTGYNSLGALGVGILDIPGALAADGDANPNAGLNRFVAIDPTTGLSTFDMTRWAAAAASDPAWNAASWSSASWSSASWSSASWSSASWSSASWANASWANASWANASWANASWANSLAAE